jgi:hypothetical protein
MVLGILSLFTCCFGIGFGIVAIVFGAVASNGMNKSRNFEGRGMATAGLVMGVLSVVGWIIFYAIMFLAGAGDAGRHHF